jgi:cobaltochelatase CobS subunit
MMSEICNTHTMTENQMSDELHPKQHSWIPDFIRGNLKKLDEVTRLPADEKRSALKTLANQINSKLDGKDIGIGFLNVRSHVMREYREYENEVPYTFRKIADKAPPMALSGMVLEMLDGLRTFVLTPEELRWSYGVMAGDDMPDDELEDITPRQAAENMMFHTWACVCGAIANPKSNAAPNSKSKNGYGYAHVEDWDQERLLDLYHKLQDWCAKDFCPVEEPKIQERTVTVTTVTADNGSLRYETSLAEAGPLFRPPHATKDSKALDFKVDVVKWFDADGNEVRHPMCPDIDENYQFRPALLQKFLASSAMGLNIWLHGHTGTGKSTFAEQCAARMGYPFYRINLDSNLERADLVGQIVLSESGGTTISRFDEGILPRAMPEPSWVCLDECDSGRPDILFVVQRALEGGGLMLTEDGGRLVKPHPQFRFIATANTRGQGDEYGLYSGVRPMNSAFMNRWHTHIEVPYLSKADEKRMLKQMFPNIADRFDGAGADGIIDQLCQFAKEMRKAFDNGEISLPVSPRDLVGTLATFHFLTMNDTGTPIDCWNTAMAMSITDKASRDNKMRIGELIDRCFGSPEAEVQSVQP